MCNISPRKRELSSIYIVYQNRPSNSTPITCFMMPLFVRSRLTKSSLYPWGPRLEPLPHLVRVALLSLGGCNAPLEAPDLLGSHHLGKLPPRLICLVHTEPNRLVLFRHQFQQRPHQGQSRLRAGAYRFQVRVLPTRLAPLIATM